MGSAAPSRLRWLAVPLLVVVGALIVAFWPGPDRGSSDGTPRAPGGQGEFAAGAEALEVAVDLSPGWSVPELEVSVPESAHGGEPVIDLVATGADTVGRSVDIPSGSKLMIVRATPSMRLAFRVVDDEGTGAWRELAVEAQEGPDGGPGTEGDLESEGSNESSSARGPFWIGNGGGVVEFVLVGGASSSFDVIFMGGDGQSSGGEVAPAGPGAVAPMVGAPPIVPRQQWAIREWDYNNEDCDQGPNRADHLQAVVIHHTVTDNGYSADDVDDILRAIHYSHVVVNGWCDIGYNFVVDRFGTIWEARTGSIEAAVVGGHTKGFNTSTLGVALLGQHHPSARPASAPPSTASEGSVAALAAWKLGQHDVDPLGKTWLRNRSSRPPLRLAGKTWHYVPTVLSHRDLGVTSCPGDHGVELVDRLPARLAAQRDVSVPYDLLGRPAHSHGPGFLAADRFGGIRPSGAARAVDPAPAAVPNGSQVVAIGGSAEAGYLLSIEGRLMSYGSAPAIGERPAGAAPVVDLEVRADGRSGWVLDRSGLLHGFGGPPDAVPAGWVSQSAVPVAVSLADDGRGYVVDEAGRLYPVGGAPPVEAIGRSLDNADVVDVDLKNGVAPTRGWVLDSRGRLHGFGGLDTTEVLGTANVAGVRAVATSETGPGGWVLDGHGQLWPFGGAPLVIPVSTDAAAAGSIDIDYVGTAYRAEFLDSDDARYLAQVYLLFTGRDASAVELDTDATALEQGSGRIAITEKLATSRFWTGGTVDQMYRDVLGRPPDAEGRAYWLDEVANGTKLADLGTYFYGSTEYAKSAGSNEAYVTRLYNAILHRPPDSEGLAYWVDELGSGRAKPPDVANGFYASIESRRDRVGRLHERILGRAPTTAEREAWAEKLPSLDDVGLAAELASSSEYYELIIGRDS